MRNELSRFATVARYTFVEVYKSRILLNVIFLGLILVLACYIASEFTFGVPERVALDFGLGLISLSGVGIAIFMGVTLISKEFESRTVYMILSRPISRTTFLFGRITGLSLILIVNFVILSSLTLVLYKMLGGEVSASIIWVISFSYIESLIMLMVVISFSLITNVVRSVMFSLAVFVGGYTLTDPTIIPYAQKSVMIPTLLKSYGFIFPDFSKINYKMLVIYEQSISIENLFGSLSYAIVYLIALCMLASVIFQHKDLN